MPDSIAVKAMKMLEDKLDEKNRAKLSEAELREATLRYLVVEWAFDYYANAPKLHAALHALLTPA